MTRLAYCIADRRYGAVPEPVTVTAHHPKLLGASVAHELLVEKAAGVVEVGARELAVYRTAVRVGCSWCVDFGTMLQRHEGSDIELTYLIGTENSRARMNHALGITDQGFTSGEACRAPMPAET